MRIRASCKNHPINSSCGRLELCRAVVFFSVRRRVSWLTDSTISSATACSASSRSVQLANPFGGWPSRNAMILASCSPSRTFPRTRFLGLPFSAISNPSVTRRSRMNSTVLVPESKASAISTSVQFGPSASAFRRTWARRTFCADTRRFLTNRFNVSRSASVSRTIYFFCMTQPSLVGPRMTKFAHARYPKLEV
jgi:hypothetical protein